MTDNAFDPSDRVHVLKCWQTPFAQIRDGKKPYEVRRGLHARVGDLLVLCEYRHADERYTGKVLVLRVAHVAPGRSTAERALFHDTLGLPADCQILTLGKVRHAGTLQLHAMRQDEELGVDQPPSGIEVDVE